MKHLINKKKKTVQLIFNMKHFPQGHLKVMNVLIHNVQTLSYYKPCRNTKSITTHSVREQ